MTPFDAWAAKWGQQCVAELMQAVGCGDFAPPLAVADKPGSEARQQSLVRLAAPKVGFWLTRNNVGALQDKRGVPVRYGLANESPQQNEMLKSADLIGIRQVVVTHEMVGRVIGQFASVEMKHEGWTYNAHDSHEAAQFRWMNFVISKGGYATFATHPSHIGAAP